MAQRVITMLVSDKSGKELKDGEGETVTFALDGVQYETDLAASEAEELRSLLAPYVDNARRTGGRRQTGTSRPRRNGTMAPEQSKAIREWAQKQGMKVSSRGRIAEDIQQAYQEAHKAS